MKPTILPALLLVVLASCSGDGPTGGGGTAPGPASTVTIVGGSSQQVPAGTAAGQPLVVQVADAQGRAVPNTAVSFTPAAGSGTVSAASASTGSDGRAQVTWTVGASAGTHTVAAQVGSIAPVTFSATVTPNATINATITFVDTFVVSRARILQSSGGFRPSMKSGAIFNRAASSGGAMRSRTTRATVPGVLVVTMRPSSIGLQSRAAGARMSRQSARSVADAMRGVLERQPAAGQRIRDLSPAIGAARLRVEPGTEDQVAAQLRNDPAILRVERDAIAYATAGVSSNDPLRATQAWHYQMIDLPRAWRRTTGSNSVIVAVVDDGIRFDHPDIAPNLTSDGYDFVSNDVYDTECGAVANAGDGNGYDGDPTTPADYENCTLSSAGGHGLHVAGTIGAVGNNGIGMSGVAWAVRIRPVRVLGVAGSGSYFDIAQGILFAAGLPASDGQGGTVQAASAARIVNLSLGGPSDVPVLRDAVVAATNAGSLLVVAAGNENTSVPSYPAAYPEVLTVSAVGPTYQRAGYSNWGTNVDIAAPGGDLAFGHWSAGIASTQWNFQTGQPTYNAIQGTSMATPHVSGAAALLLAQEPSLTAAQLRGRLLTYSVDLGTSGPDPIFGAGLLNVRNSLDQSHGPSGRLFGRIYDAATGAIVRDVQANGTTISAGQLPDGAYHVFAGIDDEGDGVFGTNGFRWGGFTGTGGALSPVQIQGAGSYTADFPIGFGSEREPNATFAAATRIMLGGSLYGRLSTTSDVDMFAVALPAGTYVFETVGPDGACGLTTNADTEIELRSSTGALIALHDDVDRDNFNYCSRLQQTVAAGSYTLAVTGYTAGWYRVIVRPA